MDRRSFVRSLGSLLGAASILNQPSRAWAGASPGRSVPKGKADSASVFDCDVAIVGGGISGIYTAWRLLSAQGTVTVNGHSLNPGRKLRVAVFEGSDRIGGRLLSASSPCLPDVKCELGGMRYMSAQKRISWLVKELELTTHELDETRNISFLRGKCLREHDLKRPDLVPYNLDDWEKKAIGKDGPEGLVGSAIRNLPLDLNQGGVKLQGRDLYAKLQTSCADGKPLYEWGFWNLLARHMSSEAYLFSRAVMGFDCLGDNANAVDLFMEYLDFAEGVEHFVIDKGFESVPWELRKRLEQLEGKRVIFLGQWLAGLDPIPPQDAGIGVQLRFRGAPKPVTAAAVVLALPKRPLELLLCESPVLKSAPGFSSLLNSVESVPLFKLFLLYPKAWWRETGVCGGRSLTDLPLRQVWYWEPCSTSCDSRAMIMAYNDSSNVAFWGGLRPVGSEPPVLPGGCPDAPSRGEGKERLSQNWAMHRASKPMLDEAHRQLLAVHGLDSGDGVPDPLEGAFMDWSDDPYGGAVHLWNQGWRSWDAVEKMISPIEKFPCYICGEAYSTNQTWVEGALETADKVLRKFDIEEPAA